MSRSPDKQPSVSLWINDVVIVCATVVCAMITWLALARIGGITLEVTTRHDAVRAVTGADVAVMAAAAAIAGLLVLRGLQWASAQGLRIWTAGALVLAVVSLFGTRGATSVAAMGTLMALHGVVAAVIIVGGYRAHRSVASRAR